MDATPPRTGLQLLAGLLLLLLLWTAFFQGGLGASREPVLLSWVADEVSQTHHLPHHLQPFAMAWPAYGPPAVLHRWLESPQWYGSIFGAVLAILLVCSVAEASRRGRGSAVTALLAAGATPALVEAASSMSLDLPAAASGAFLLYLLRGVDEDQRSWRHIAIPAGLLGGLALALAGVVHPALGLTGLVLLPLSLLGFPEPRGRLGAGMLLFVSILGLVGNLWLVAWKGDGVEALLRGWQDLRWSPEGAPLVQDLRAMLLPTGPLALTGWVGLVGLVVGRDLPGCRRAATWLLAVACARALGAGGELAPLLYLPGLAVGAGAMGARLGRWHLALAALCLVVGALVCGGRLDTAYNRLEGIPILARELPADGTGKVYCFPETQARLQAVPSSPAPARLALPPAVEPAEFLELLREGDVLLLSPGDALASPELYQAAREVYDTHGGGVILTPTRRLPLPWLPPRAPAGLILEGPVPR